MFTVTPRNATRANSLEIRLIVKQRLLLDGRAKSLDAAILRHHGHGAKRAEDRRDGGQPIVPANLASPATLLRHGERKHL